MDMAQAVQQNSVDEDNRRFVPDEVWESVEEVEETLEYLISQYGAKEGPLVYPVIIKETQDNVGYVQLCPIDNGNWEIGYHIGKKYTGNGYATEAVGAFAQRNTAIVSDKLLTNFIQVSRSDTGTNMTAHLGESFTDEAGTVTYQFYFFFSL